MKLKVFTLLSVVVFVAGLVFAISGKQRPGALTAKEISRLAGEAVPGRAFKAIQIETTTDAEGNDTVRHIRICQVKPDGAWSETWQSIGHEGQAFHTGDPLKGEYTLANSIGQSMTIPNTIPGSNLVLYRSANYLARRADFHGKEKIAGLDAYVLRSEIPEQRGLWIESAHAPETGPFYLKLVMHLPDGSETRIETVRVTFK